MSMISIYRKLLVMAIKVVLGIIIIFFSYLISLGTPFALAQTSVTDLIVNLGNPNGELKFFPEYLEFVAGPKYKFILDNPSPTKYYFTAKDFADASSTQKGEAGKVEIKGAIHELELKPTAKNFILNS